ncbi:transposase [Caenispirillum bisanense]|uniref:Transposase n=2 Tax=Caenispirillum bisanense TaxID=414052 RepID=A0A286H238_9PROT|nr:transposase [Caenispirillum bisanense]
MSWLGGWEGYRVKRVERREGETPEIWVHLDRRPSGGMIGDGCGNRGDSVHDVEMRMVRDLPILEARTWLSVPRRRVACPHCGQKLERLTWLDRHARVTRRLADSVVRLCAVLPIKQVASFFGLGLASA